MEPLEQRLGLRAGLALDGPGHEGGRGPRDGASGAPKADVADHVAVHPDPDGQFVPAQRIVPVGLPVRILHDAEISRRAIVLEDDVLVELAETRHQAKTLRTRRSPRTRASTSARVL